LEKNIETLGADADIRVGSVLHLGQARQPYDLVLMDPPYDSGAGWFAPSAWIAIETARHENIEVKGFKLDCTRDSGKARIHLLRPDAI